MQLRKIQIVKETLTGEMGRTAERAVTRVAALAVIANPFAGRYAEDLSELFPIGAELGERLSGELAGMLPAPAISYGKAAVVGAAGEFEHGGACIHPMLGKPMRAAIGGGKAVIPSNVRVGGPGTVIDVPLGHKDDPWSFDHFDTMTVMVPDAPRPDEIVVILALADGGRLFPRCGGAPR